MPINQSDFSVVVKLRAPPPNSWRWEIYRAGKRNSVEQSSVYFQTMTMASRKATWPQNTPTAKRKIVKEKIISEPYPISQRSPRLGLPEDVGRESDDKCNDT
jgi:hypothetical protein